MAVSIKTVLANNTKRARAALAISQDELAARSGLHRTYIGGIERAERNISLASLQKLADAVGKSASELLENDVDRG